MVINEPHDALQVAMVRLRLESVPFKLVHRGDFAGPEPGGHWPFLDDRCVLFCRTTLNVGDRVPATDLFATSTVTPGYVLEDGVERAFAQDMTDPLRAAALALRGVVTWMSSGWVGP